MCITAAAVYRPGLTLHRSWGSIGASQHRNIEIVNINWPCPICTIRHRFVQGLPAWPRERHSLTPSHVRNPPFMPTQERSGSCAIDRVHPPSRRRPTPAPIYPHSPAASPCYTAAPPWSRWHTRHWGSRRWHRRGSFPGRSRSRCIWSCRCRSGWFGGSRPRALRPRW